MVRRVLRLGLVCKTMTQANLKWVLSCATNRLIDRLRDETGENVLDKGLSYDEVVLGRRSIRGFLQKPVPRALNCAP